MLVDSFFDTIGVVVAFAIVFCVFALYRWIKGIIVRKVKSMQEEKKRQMEAPKATSEEEMYISMYK